MWFKRRNHLNYIIFGIKHSIANTIQQAMVIQINEGRDPGEKKPHVIETNLH